MLARALPLALIAALTGCATDARAPAEPPAPSTAVDAKPPAPSSAAATGSERPPVATATQSSCELLCKSRPTLAAPANTAKKLARNVLTDDQGRRVDLAGGGNTWSVVSIVADITPPSEEQALAFAALADALAGRKEIGLVLVVAQEGGGRSLERTLQGTPLAKEVHVIRDKDSAVATAFGTSRFPETFFVDGAGRVRARYDGAIGLHSVGFQKLLGSLVEGAECAVSIHHGLGADGTPDPGKRIVAEGADAETCMQWLGGRR